MNTHYFATRNILGTKVLAACMLLPFAPGEFVCQSAVAGTNYPVATDTTAVSGAIGSGFTGSWFDPAQSGHGLMLEVLPGNRLLAFWFTFNPEGNQQVWFGGVGTYSENAAIISEVALPTGGRWIPNFDSTKVIPKNWGSLSFTFSDCNHGRVDFNSILGFGAGGMDLTRLTLPAGLTCP